MELTVKSSSAHPGVAINPTSLEITEGGSDSYTVVLTAEADGDRKRGNVSGAADDVRVSPDAAEFLDQQLEPGANGDGEPV